MIKKTLIAFLSIICAIPAFGQLTMDERGRISVGNCESPLRISEAAILKNDSTSELRIIGNYPYATGGKIIFGDRASTSIGESIIANASSDRRTDLVLQSSYGILYNTVNGKNIFSYRPKSLFGGVWYDNIFTFNCSVGATQYLTSSDQRLKSDIRPVSSIGESLDALVPVAYYLTEDQSDSPESGKSSKATGSSKGNLHYGFIAQEVKEVYPDLVYEKEDGTLCMDYQGFIPILTDAIQTLKSTVADQSEEIAELQRTIKELKGENGKDGFETAIRLMQNRPNPFRVSTAIDCIIPETVANAELMVFDLAGNPKTTIKINGRGKVTTTIEANTLQPGMYIYSLIADGQEIDAKRMILTD